MASVRLMLLAPLAALLLCGVAFARPYGQVRHNPADKLVSLPIDDYHYDYAKRCRKHPMAGTLVLQSWLEKNWRGVSWGIMRCEKLGKRKKDLDETLAHRNHVHIGLNLAGARKKTSFWKHRR